MTDAIDTAVLHGAVLQTADAHGARAVWKPAVHSALAVNYSTGIASAPLCIEAERMATLMRDLDAIHHRISDIFSESIGEENFLRQGLGLNKYQSRLVQECLAIEIANGFRRLYDETPVMRADLLSSDSGPALIELNYTSACGGFDEELVSGAIRSRGAIAPHLDSPGAHTNILDGLLVQLQKIAGSNVGTVALVDSVESYRTYRPRLEILQDLLETRGISALHMTVDQVGTARDGGLVHRESGQRIDTVWRFFMLDEIEGQEGLDAIRPEFDAWAAGRCVLFGSLVEEAKSSKSLLARLFQDDRLALENRGLVPEGFTIGGHSRASAGQGEALANHLWEEAFASPANWVMKEPFGHGGYGVLIGDQIPVSDWKGRMKAAAVASDVTVLQRRVREVPLPIPDDAHGPLAARVNLGLFLAPHDSHPYIPYFGGCFVRLSLDEGSKIGLSLGAATGIVLVTNSIETGMEKT